MIREASERGKKLGNRNYALEYAESVLSGKEIVGEYIRLACQRFIDDCERDDLEFDIDEGCKVINFFEKKLCHVEDKWKGKPIILEPWQKFVLMQVFGWMKLDGTRRIRTCYLQIARKNGKTLLAAGLAVFHMFADRVETPQVLIGSNNEDQAKICSTAAGKLIENSKSLKHLIKKRSLDIYKYKGKVKAINYIDKDAYLEAMSGDPETKDGFNPSLGIIDEYHEAETDALLNVIESGQGARTEPLTMVITTAGFNKQGPCFMQLRKVSRDILNKILEDDSHLAIIYELDEKDDWEDQNNWYKCSPNFGISPSLAYMEAMFRKAKNLGGTKEVDFKTKNLNQWVDAPETWIDTKIIKGNSKGLIKKEDLIGGVCYGGLDLAQTNDISAFALVHVNEDKEPIAATFLIWVTENMIEKNLNKVVFYEWIDKGFLRIAGEDSYDYDIIASDIIEEVSKYNMVSMANDKHLTNHGIVKHLKDNNIQCTDMVQTTVYLNHPTSTLDNLIKHRKIELFNNPVIEWMFSNVVVFRDTSGNIKPDKKRSENKIDGVSALVNAIGEWITFANKEESDVDIWLI